MNCVRNAVIDCLNYIIDQPYSDVLKHKGLHCTAKVGIEFDVARHATKNLNGFIYAGIVPFILDRIYEASMHDFRYGIKSFLTKDSYLEMANDLEYPLVSMGKFCTIPDFYFQEPPFVYLPLYNSHAICVTDRVPDDYLMLIKILI